MQALQGSHGGWWCGGGRSMCMCGGGVGWGGGGVGVCLWGGGLLRLVPKLPDHTCHPPHLSRRAQWYPQVVSPGWGWPQPTPGGSLWCHPVLGARMTPWRPHRRAMPAGAHARQSLTLVARALCTLQRVPLEHDLRYKPGAETAGVGNLACRAAGWGAQIGVGGAGPGTRATAAATCTHARYDGSSAYKRVVWCGMG